MKTQRGILLGTGLFLVLHAMAAGAETPLRLWSHSSEVGFVCSVEGERQAADAPLCQRLARIVAQKMAYPVVRRDAGVRGATLHVVLRPADNGALVGTLQARRPAFQDETDGASRRVPLHLARAQPDAAFRAALTTILPATVRISRLRKDTLE